MIALRVEEKKELRKTERLGFGATRKGKPQSRGEMASAGTWVAMGRVGSERKKKKKRKKEGGFPKKEKTKV